MCEPGWSRKLQRTFKHCNRFIVVIPARFAHCLLPGHRDLQGVEYTLDSFQDPHLFVISKQMRQAPDAAATVMYYYILDGSIYQTPTIHGALSARLVRLEAVIKKPAYHSHTC